MAQLKQPSETGKKKVEMAKLFKELKVAEGDCKRSLQLCDAILRLSPDDEDAVGYKIKTLVEYSRFPDCIKFADGLSAKLVQKYAMHIAYANYRQGKLAKAQDILVKSGASKTEGGMHLMAQINYKNEEFGLARNQYEEIRKHHSDQDDEILCNLTASMICEGKLSDALSLLTRNKDEMTMDLWYNRSCIFVEREEWAEAQKLLNEAEAACRAEFAAEGGAKEEEILDDLATVEVQRHYIKYRLGDEAASEAGLTEVLRRKPSSLATYAVAVNNLCALHREKSPFDSFKRIKPLREALYETKLSRSQRHVVRYNTSLLLNCMGKPDQAKAMAAYIAKDDPTSELAPLALIAVLGKEKKFGRAEDQLRAFLDRLPADKRQAGRKMRLTLAQLHFQQGNLKAAMSQLREVPEIRHLPSVVASLVSAYEAQGDVGSAIAVLDESLAYHKEKKGSDEIVTTLLKSAAQLKLKQRQWVEAAEAFQAIRKMDKRAAKDQSLLADLVHCMAKVDIAEAERMANDLPAMEASHITPEQAADLLALKTKELALSAVKSSLKRRVDDEEEAQPRKKKKRSKKPSAAEGEVDPERWMRKRDRASYKALTKRQIREMRKERQEKKMKRLRQLAQERETCRDIRRQHYAKLAAEQ